MCEDRNLMIFFVFHKLKNLSSFRFTIELHKVMPRAGGSSSARKERSDKRVVAKDVELQQTAEAKRLSALSVLGGPGQGSTLLRR